MTRTILVTGGTSGFGAAAVTRFLAGGWRVIATGRRAERLQALVDAHGSERLHTCAFDIRDEGAMHAALDALPPEFREAVVLREYADFTYQDIADHQGVAVATVKTRLNRGRAKLKAALVEAGFG